MKKAEGNHKYLIGLDEVGRGALAGPMVVGAVMLESGSEEALLEEIYLNCKLKCLKDSKKMTLLARERIFEYLKDKINWSVGTVLPQEIDEYKLTSAVRMAADRAISGLDALPTKDTLVQADAGLFHSREGELETRRYIKGDENYLAIMIASIMAKVWRDRLMVKLSAESPEYAGYGWERNVGYGTAEHQSQIRLKGLTDQHRRLFCSTFTQKNANL